MDKASFDGKTRRQRNDEDDLQRLLPVELFLDNATNTEPSDHESSSTAADATLTSVKHAVRLLYISHTLARASELAWQFGVVLILSQAVASQSSLILVSTYGACVRMAVVVTAGRCGRAIDQGNDPDDSNDDVTQGGRGKALPPRRNRWQTVRRLIVAENLAVLAATGACLILLQPTPSMLSDTRLLYRAFTNNTGDFEHHSRDNRKSYSSAWDGLPSDARSIVCLVAIHVLGALAQVLDQTMLVAMERDWVVVLCQTAAQALSVRTVPDICNYGTWAPVSISNHDEDDSNAGSLHTRKENLSEASIFHQWLSRINVTMKQIDLSCKVLAPTVTGWVFPLLSSVSSTSRENGETANARVDYTWACWAVGTATVVSLIVEYVCTARIYQLVPALACRRENLKENVVAKRSMVPLSTPVLISQECNGEARRHVKQWWLPQDLRVYFEQQSALGGLGFAVLNANPLTFGNGIMMAYLLSRGMQLPVVGSLRGLSGMVGLLGTVAYHFSMKHQSLKGTCLWGILYQSVCLGVSLISLLAFSTATFSLGVFVGGVCASRIGLWMYYVGITQMQQEQVPSAIRGQVGGTQESLNSCFNILSFVLGFVYPDPKDFVMFVVAAFASVAIAACLYIAGVYKVQTVEARLGFEREYHEDHFSPEEAGSRVRSMPKKSTTGAISEDAHSAIMKTRNTLK